ncbi:ACP S-malonyltransferase [Amphibacillus indicireducens]|uniref:Malonyl CoA-acyl carrier protein transacylase n=1 Tax=Amphibacillus indicireducens TaxID=1076330 RepID=A0ABP7VAX9_9BACI
MKKLAFVFPGQGSQKVGMGQSLLDSNPANQALFDQADQLLDFSLTKMIQAGPESELTKTAHAQPALLLMSTMVYRELLNREIKPSVVAGHSLGEYSALVASGVLDFEDAIPLVHERGKLMEQAYPEGAGAMAAVLGLDQQTIEQQLADLDEIVDLANINCPGQIVISGTKAGIDQAIPLLKNAGAKRVIPLNVSGPFHSRLMREVAENFKAVLSRVSFSQPTIPVYSNVTAKQVENADQSKELLVKQLYSPVRFEEIIEDLLEQNLDAIVEVGNGKVLAGLVKKVSRRAQVFSVYDQVSLDQLTEWYREGE